MNDFLEASDVIDWRDDRIKSIAEELTAQAAGELCVAKGIFEWVRDNVEHSVDFKRSEVTLRASDVLTARTGICYAKSHLVAALMRASGIPAGFCYQRLSVKGDGPPFCLHGLNAVLLNKHGWYRIDARGNTDTINAAFSPPHERLAFNTADPGEADLPEIWSAPIPIVVAALSGATSVEQLQLNLPDVPIIKSEPPTERTVGGRPLNNSVSSTDAR